MEFEIEAIIESKEGCDWPVKITYEVSRSNIQPTGVYNDDDESDYHCHLGNLSKEQYHQVLRECQEDYNYRCEMAEAAIEDAAEARAEDRRMEERYG